MANSSIPPLHQPGRDGSLTKIDIPEARRSAVRAVDPRFVSAYQQAASNVHIGVVHALAPLYDFERDEPADGSEERIMDEPLTPDQLERIQTEDGLLEVIDQILAQKKPVEPAQQPTKSKPPRPF